MKSKRDELVETALRLFYTQGFNATGIDKILAESGVAKMTMYKHFKSKDELIDRKSTRLNSSHLGISYAVFCLKKKKKKKKNI